MGELENRFRRDNPVSSRIPLDANLDRSIEEHCLDVGVVKIRSLDVRAPFLSRQVRGIDVRNRAPELEPVSQKESNRREHPPVNGLAGRIVDEQFADGIA